MAKHPNIYFAIKLVAPTIGKRSTLVLTSSIVFVTGSMSGIAQAANRTKSIDQKKIVIGDGEARAFHGIANHFVAAILDFTDKENAQCKSLLEAEQLVKTKKKYWLTDAYDWFVLPGYVNETSPSKAIAGKLPSKAKPAKKTASRVSKKAKTSRKK